MVFDIYNLALNSGTSTMQMLTAALQGRFNVPTSKKHLYLLWNKLLIGAITKTVTV